MLSVRTSSYGCTWEVWRALKKLELLSAAPRATLTLLSCSPNFPRASITRCTHAKHEPIVKLTIFSLNSSKDPKGGDPRDPSDGDVEGYFWGRNFRFQNFFGSGNLASIFLGDLI